ncbi:TRAP transporter small permease [Xenophilus arseniciresistens]|uniref:TRAP transporter small permease protein n=1 Tax=Xenophilus arseniciresistens TaxID=1283306 RepID=A0AAE3SYY3_9BURK|nr:TRAP transporter small permease [Xenophilus arseniciresistens]MDA7415985.1 TRAP transporter small permease [Xenophilus arseniciresistens]
MSIIERAVVGICKLILWISTTVIFLILVGNTVLRYGSGMSLQWANEVPELLFPWLVMSGIVLAASRGAHITTTFMVEALPPAWQRWLAVGSWTVVAALYGTLAWSTAKMLEIVHDERSQILQIPGSITYACVMCGMAMLAALALQSAWHALRQVPGQEPPATQAGTDAAEQRVPSVHW